MNGQIEALKKAIVEGEDSLAVALVKECLETGLDPGAMLNQAIIPGIEEAGHLWSINQYFMPDIIMCAEAFKAAISELKQGWDPGQSQYVGRVLIGTVEGDMHDLGKSIVIAMLSGASFEVIDLGIDVPLSVFIEKTRELRPDILGLGAYMTTTVLLMRDIIAALGKEGLRDKVKVLIGGIPTSTQFADEIGADGWGRDALDAVAKARQLISK